MNYADLESKTMVELYKIARELEIPSYYKLRKKELIFEIKSPDENTASCLPKVFGNPARRIRL